MNVLRSRSSLVSNLARAALACALLGGLAGGCGGDPPRVQACSAADDCADDQACDGGVCQAAAPTGTSPFGGGCASSRDCLVSTDGGPALSCELDGTGLRDGLCTTTCAGSAGGACTAGAICADLRATPVNEKICLPACSTDAACRGAGASGWTCCAAASACLPPGLCPQAATGASSTLGLACPLAGCSAGETCRTGPGFPGGSCVKTCVIGGAGTCPTNGRCTETAQGPLCLKACGVVTDCASGYACSAPAGGGDQVCQGTAATERTCGGSSPPVLRAGGTVGPSAAPAACVKPAARSSLPAAQVQALGRHTVGEEVHFTVPAGSGSISIVEQAVAAKNRIAYQGVSGGYLPNTAVPTRVKLPGGALIYDDGVAPPKDLATAQVYFATSAPGTSMMTLPNTSAGLAMASGGLPGGTWSFTVNDYALECLSDSKCGGGSSTGVYDISVLVKPAPPPASATIDVAFYLVGAANLTSATAVNDASVKRMVSTLSAFYAPAGICLGSVTFYDVPAWAKARYATGINADDDSPCSNLSQMFTLARAGNTLNFFLVGAITASNSNGGQVVGIDGSIPGPSTLGGTIHSGAAVNGSDLKTVRASGACTSSSIQLGTCGADQVAYIAAHEGGHWLGLYHTTEAGGDTHDPIADTATCPCSLCAPTDMRAKCGNGTNVNAADCNAASTCGGGDDLMFWQLQAAVSKGRLSAQQGQVARANLVAQ